MPLRVALVGYGFAGRTFHAPLLSRVPGLQLHTVVSADAGKVHADLAGVRVLGRPEQAFADDAIDLVVIATPNDTHAPLARAALDAGRNVVVDKPFTTTLPEARALAALAQARGRLMSVFHNRRWDSDFLGVRQAIADGLVGDVVHFESHFDRFRPQVRARWREQAGAGGGLWWDLGPHLVDQALQLFGLPDSVQASFAAQRGGAQAVDWAHVVLAWGARRAVLHGSMLVAGGSARFTVHGSRGSLVKPRIDRQEAQLLRGMRPGDPGWGEDDDALLLYDGSDAPAVALPAPAGDQRAYYVAVRDALLGRGDNPVTPLQAIAVISVLEAAEASAREGRALPLALTDAECAAWR